MFLQITIPQLIPNNSSLEDLSRLSYQLLELRGKTKHLKKGGK